jgi:large subunit ribosomal protein L25
MNITITAKKRNTSANTKALRGKGWIPACVYGHHFKSTPIQISVKEARSFMSKHATKFTLSIEGGEKVMVGVDEVQRTVLGDKLMHISFHALSMNERADLVVPIELVGTAKGLSVGGILKEQFHEITMRGLPANLPDKIVVDVSGLDIGNNIHVSDLVGAYPKCEFLKEDLDKIVVSCGHPKMQLVEEVPAAVEMAEETAETAAAAAAGATTGAAAATAAGQTTVTHEKVKKAA